MRKLTQEDRQQIAVDVFQLTGQKLEMDDPLVTAALFYCELLRRSQEESQHVMVSLVSEVEQRFSEIAAQTTIRAQQQIVAGLRQEVDRLQLQLTGFARDVVIGQVAHHGKPTVQGEAHRIGTEGPTTSKKIRGWRAALSTLLILSVGLTIGVILRSIW